MKVLVTGGAGFIGSHVVDLLVSQGHDVLSVDAVTGAAHAATPDYLNAGAEHRLVNLVDLDALEDALVGVDAVCHQAARVGLGVDFSDVSDYVDRQLPGDGDTAQGHAPRGFEAASSGLDHGGVRRGRLHVQ